MILQGSKTQKYKTLHNPEKVNLSLQLCSYSCPKDCYHLQDIWKGLWFLTRWLTTLKTSAHCWKGLKFKIRVHCSRKPAWGIRDSETCPGLFLCSPSQNPSWWITCSPRPNASCASFVTKLLTLYFNPLFTFLVSCTRLSALLRMDVICLVKSRYSINLVFKWRL